MKKYLLLILGIPLIFGGITLATGNDKKNICHATSSETNPYEAISVADNNNTHDGHEKDFPYNGPVKDNGQPTKDGDKWCEENAPKPPKEEPPVTPEQPKPEVKVNKPTKIESAPVEAEENEFIGGK